MASRPQITLYVDVVSPFAYEAFYIFQNDGVFKDCDVRYVPIFLGGLMKTCGNTAPIFIKNKDKWIMTERVRWARAFGVPMKDETPAGFPPRTLTAMRALSVVAALDGEGEQRRLVRLLDALFRSFWVEHQAVQDREVLAPLFRSVLGDDESRQVLDTLDTEGKTRLSENTARAFADGAFGLPWMVCTNAAGQKESFWGVDHLGQVVQFLGLAKPREGGWKALL